MGVLRCHTPAGAGVETTCVADAHVCNTGTGAPAMKVLTPKFESPLTASAHDQFGPISASGPRHQTVWTWGGP